MVLLTADNLRRAIGCTPAVASQWWQPLREACAACDITTPRRAAAFLATIGHESANLTRVSENLNYSADRLMMVWPSRYTAELATAHAGNPRAIACHVYGNRMGNRTPADGYTFKGRGPMQITGRAGYADATRLTRLQWKDAPDFERTPDALESPLWGSRAAASWWNACGLNALADAGDMLRITKRVNGGTHGLNDRAARYARALGALT